MKQTLIILLATLVGLLACADAACPNCWTRNTNSCYRFKFTNTTWDNAKTACTGMGGFLARIDTADEATFLKQTLLERHPDANAISLGYWIDGSDTVQEGHWVLGNGEPTTFFDWGSGEPNNGFGNDEDCVCMSRFQNFRWNDVPCATQLAYICEVDNPLDSGCQPVVG